MLHSTHTCFNYSSHRIPGATSYGKIPQVPCSPRNPIFLPPFQPNFPLVPIPIPLTNFNLYYVRIRTGFSSSDTIAWSRDVLLQLALKHSTTPPICPYTQKHAFNRLPIRHHRDVPWLRQYLHRTPASLTFLTRLCLSGRFGAPFELTA